MWAASRAYEQSQPEMAHLLSYASRSIRRNSGCLCRTAISASTHSRASFSFCGLKANSSSAFFRSLASINRFGIDPLEVVAARLGCPSRKSRANPYRYDSLAVSWSLNLLRTAFMACSIFALSRISSKLSITCASVDCLSDILVWPSESRNRIRCSPTSSITNGFLVLVRTRSPGENASCIRSLLPSVTQPSDSCTRFHENRTSTYREIPPEIGKWRILCGER